MGARHRTTLSSAQMWAVKAKVHRGVFDKKLILYYLCDLPVGWASLLEPDLATEYTVFGLLSISDGINCENIHIGDGDFCLQAFECHQCML